MVIAQFPKGKQGDLTNVIERLQSRILALASLLSLPSALAKAQESEVISGGELEYQDACTICHGLEARGNGIMSNYLTVPPASCASFG